MGADRPRQLLVIVADAAQNGMSGDYKSITDGFILVATLIAWNVLIDWLVFAVPGLQRILEPPPLLIIDNGRVLHRNLRIEFMSQADLVTVIKKVPSSSSA